MHPYDVWKTGINTAHFDDQPEYDYDEFGNLPYEYVKKADRFRDVETKAFVKSSVAIDANDKICERVTREIEEENRYHDRMESRGEY